MLVAERYRLGSSLGRGGMGEVFRAVDEQLGRPVAVKLMLPSDRDPRAAERFRREARAAARLNDPHVVAVYDFGQQGDEFFLVMELVEGRTVAAELAEQGSLPMDRAIDIVEQSAAGLAAAHRQGVVHRDVKPGNLLVAPGGTVKVADFGIAQLPGEGGTTLTAAGQIIGSTLYLAPERAQGGQAAEAADVYALGCVLYQLVTGQPPFTAEHPTAILYQHVDTAPVPPSASRPELGGSFETVLLAMLAKDPAQRPTAEAIAAGALRAQPLNGSGELATTAVAPVVEAQTTPAIVGSSSQHPQRKKALLAGGVAIAATAAAVLAVILIGDNGTKPPATTDVGPQPGAVSSTPEAGTSSGVPTGPTQAGNSTEATRSTSPEPSPSTSRQTSPTPQTSSGTPSTGTPNTSPPSTSPSSSTTTGTPTRNTPSPTVSPSSTPAPEDPPTSTPSAGTPTPNPQNGVEPRKD